MPAPSAAACATEAGATREPHAISGEMPGQIGLYLGHDREGIFASDTSCLVILVGLDVLRSCDQSRGLEKLQGMFGS